MAARMFAAGRSGGGQFTQERGIEWPSQPVRSRVGRCNSVFRHPPTPRRIPRENMSHTVRFKVALTCTYCGSPNPANAVHLYTSSFGQDPVDAELSLGGIIELELLDFADGFYTLQPPAVDVSAVAAVELWGCSSCDRMQPVRLDFRRVERDFWRLESVSPVALTPEALANVHYLSRKLEEYAPGPNEPPGFLGELRARLEASTPGHRPG